MQGSTTSDDYASLLRARKPNYDPMKRRMQEQKEQANYKPISKELRDKGVARMGKPLHTRIASHWDKDSILGALDTKIESYAFRHGHGNVEQGRKRLVADRTGKGEGGAIRQKELAILDKMRKDEQAGALRLPVEFAADNALRTGLREYVDYAVDEVERFTQISKTGAVTAEFDWSACGDFHDVPALRRSSGMNRVDGPPSHMVGLGHGSDDMFTMDFLRDFVTRSNAASPSDDFCLQRMKLCATEMKAPRMFRADNGAPLFEDESPSRFSDDDFTLPDPNPQGKFGYREWAVEYSVV